MNTIPNWEYKGRKIQTLQDLPPGSMGIIYMIRFPDTDQAYIGKKNLISVRKKRFSKTKIAAMPDKRAKKYEYVYKESDWLNYVSSSDPVNELIAAGRDYTREILDVGKTKHHLTYLETKYLFKYGVLEGDDASWFNNSILGKFYRNSIR